MSNAAFCVLVSAEVGSAEVHAHELRNAFALAGATSMAVERPRLPPAANIAEALASGAAMAELWQRAVADFVAAGCVVVAFDGTASSGAIHPEVMRRIERIATSSCPPQYSALVTASPDKRKKNHFDAADADARKAQMAAFAKGCMAHHARQGAIFQGASR